MPNLIYIFLAPSNIVLCYIGSVAHRLFFLASIGVVSCGQVVLFLGYSFLLVYITTPKVIVVGWLGAKGVFSSS